MFSLNGNVVLGRIIRLFEVKKLEACEIKQNVKKIYINDSKKTFVTYDDYIEAVRISVQECLF